MQTLGKPSFEFSDPGAAHLVSYLRFEIGYDCTCCFQLVTVFPRRAHWDRFIFRAMQDENREIVERQQMFGDFMGNETRQRCNS